MNVNYRALSFASCGLAAAVSLTVLPFLPERVATRFRSNGRAKRYRSRVVAAASSPAVMLAIAVLNKTIGGWVGGQDRDDTVSGTRARDEAIGIAQVALLVSHLLVLANALSLPVDMDRVPRALYGLMLVALGNVLPKVPRNALVGIRTPWTLRDPGVWERTHRLAGYLCVTAGGMVVAFAPARSAFARSTPVVASLAATGAATAYSWWASRDPV